MEAAAVRSLARIGERRSLELDIGLDLFVVTATVATVTLVTVILITMTEITMTVVTVICRFVVFYYLQLQNGVVW